MGIERNPSEQSPGLLVNLVSLVTRVSDNLYLLKYMYLRDSACSREILRVSHHSGIFNFLARWHSPLCVTGYTPCGSHRSMASNCRSKLLYETLCLAGIFHSGTNQYSLALHVLTAVLYRLGTKVSGLRSRAFRFGIFCYSLAKFRISPRDVAFHTLDEKWTTDTQG